MLSVHPDRGLPPDVERGLDGCTLGFEDGAEEVGALEGLWLGSAERAIDGATLGNEVVGELDGATLNAFVTRG